MKPPTAAEVRQLQDEIRELRERNRHHAARIKTATQQDIFLQDLRKAFTKIGEDIHTINAILGRTHEQ